MTRGLGPARDRIVNAAVGVELRKMLIGLRDSLTRQESASASTSADIIRQIQELTADQAKVIDAQATAVDTQSTMAAELFRLIQERADHAMWQQDRTDPAGVSLTRFWIVNPPEQLMYDTFDEAESLFESLEND